MQRSIVKQEYANFLRKLIYSIENIDWSKNRPAQMMKLLCHLEKRYGDWPEDVKKERKQVEHLIDMFEKEEISETDFSKQITMIMKSLE